MISSTIPCVTGFNPSCILHVVYFLKQGTVGSDLGNGPSTIRYSAHRNTDPTWSIKRRKKTSLKVRESPIRAWRESDKKDSFLLQQYFNSGASEALVYSYKRSFNGFAAKLTKQEAEKIADMEGVLSVIPNRLNKLHTTRSWDFMGFPQESRRAKAEGDVIIGMLDSGIWPESESLDDKGLGPPPSKWKGTSQPSSNFTCNNKIIGAKFYLSSDAPEVKADNIDYSPRDTDGHGTHTASTAAGGIVSGASLLGLGTGMARGGVPSARIDVFKVCFKVCWSFGCYNADILAGFDDAIADGVDIISISVGGSFALQYWGDPIAIGAFHAMKNGILTSNSAGNSGPGRMTLVNFWPWSLTVGASTIDRRFVTKVKLGNGKVFEGVAVNTFNLENQMYPLVYGGDVPNTAGGFQPTDSRFCNRNTLNESAVKGKIVLCDDLSDGLGPAFADAMGTIMQDGVYSDYAFSYLLPATYVGFDVGGEVSKYINTTSNPTATILKSNEAKDISAPYVVSFSSRGPNPMTTNILKPDVTAPGVDILAAWSPVAPISSYPSDKRVVPYNIISGTSMSCPHATAAAAYIKSFHLSWSPAAIKSALMTTAFPMSNETNTDAELAYGSGHINPIRAVDPGLIYDAGEADYVRMLCGEGYDTKTLQVVTGDNSSCTAANNGTVWDLNYPSFALSIELGKAFDGTFHRTVTNVGNGSTTYKATIVAPQELKVRVVLSVLSFQLSGEKQSFVVKIEGMTKKTLVSGFLTWSDEVHQVRSPIAVLYPYLV